jgi:predicted esterase
MIRLLMISLLLLDNLLFVSAQRKFAENSFKLTSQPGLKIEYLTYLPKTYSTQPRYTPLLIFLHGGEEIGGELGRIKKSVPLSLIEKGQDFDFIIIAPHLPPEKASAWDTELVKQAIDDARGRYRIDPSKIYIMGLGKGAAGAWSFAVAYPDLIAAAIPIGGYGEVSRACKMKDVPVWAFHKKSATANNSTTSMVRALQKCNSQVLYNEYTDGWSNLVDDRNVFDWMLAQSKNRFMTFGKNKVNDKTLSYKLPLALKNASGILKAPTGGLWAINDGQGRQPLLYNFDTAGHVTRIVRVADVPNIDWEDMTQDDKGNIFIADVGNDRNTRKNFSVYRIKFDQITTADKVIPEIINFTLPDQRVFPPTQDKMNFDIESSFWFNNSIYFFSKNRTKPFTGYSKLYRIPDVAGTHVAQLVDSLKIAGQQAEKSWITAATLSPDLKTLALLGHDKMWMISGFTPGKFCDGKITEISLNNSTVKKALTFHTGNTVLILDEYFTGTNDGNLYFVTF